MNDRGNDGANLVIPKLAPKGDKDPFQSPVAQEAIQALLYQLYETEIGGVEIYRTALECAIDADLVKEWNHYLEETLRHVAIARDLLVQAGLDPDVDVPPRLPVRASGRGLVTVMRTAQAAVSRADAQVTAAECVVQAETKDHMNWSLVGMLAKEMSGPFAQALRAAHAEVEKQEDHHLYHNTGWARELWVQALGMKAVLPPPEEVKDVDTQMGAARAKAQRKSRT